MKGIKDTILIQRLLGQRLCAARKKAGLSRPKLAELLNASPLRPYETSSQDGLTMERLKQWEYGNNPLALEWIPAICEVLIVDVGYLFGEYDESTRGISDVVEQTGLSASAVEALETCKAGAYPFGPETISMFLEAPECYTFFASFSRLFALAVSLQEKLSGYPENALGRDALTSASDRALALYALHSGTGPNAIGRIREKWTLELFGFQKACEKLTADMETIIDEALREAEIATKRKYREASAKAAEEIAAYRANKEGMDGD